MMKHFGSIAGPMMANEGLPENAAQQN